MADETNQRDEVSSKPFMVMDYNTVGGVNKNVNLSYYACARK